MGRHPRPCWGSPFLRPPYGTSHSKCFALGILGKTCKWKRAAASRQLNSGQHASKTTPDGHQCFCPSTSECGNATSTVMVSPYLSACIDDCGTYGECRLLRSYSYLYASCVCKAGRGRGCSKPPPTSGGKSPVFHQTPTSLNSSLVWVLAKRQAADVLTLCPIPPWFRLAWLGLHGWPHCPDLRTPVDRSSAAYPQQSAVYSPHRSGRVPLLHRGSLRVSLYHVLLHGRYLSWSPVHFSLHSTDDLISLTHFCARLLCVSVLPRMWPARHDCTMHHGLRHTAVLWFPGLGLLHLGHHPLHV